MLSRATRVYIDHGISGTKRERPGLDQALAAVRTGDTLVVPKLDRLARSVPDARNIGYTLAIRGVSLSLGGQNYDPDDPMGSCSWHLCTYRLRVDYLDGGWVVRGVPMRQCPAEANGLQFAALLVLVCG